jgi:hypothetical protein
MALQDEEPWRVPTSYLHGDTQPSGPEYPWIVISCRDSNLEGSNSLPSTSSIYEYCGVLDCLIFLWHLRGGKFGFDKSISLK